MNRDPQHIEELIRSKLGDAEITPSKGVWKGVQRQLRMNKFMRFDPGRFNAWYLGGLLVAAAVVVILITKNTSDQGPLLRSPEQEIINEELITGQAPESGLAEDNSEVNKASETNPVQGTEQEVLANERSGQEAALSGDIREPAGSEATEGSGDQSPAAQDPVSKEPVRQTLVTYFTASVQSGCVPLHVRFFNTSVNAASVSWSFGTGEVTMENNPGYTFTEPGTYAVTLHAKDIDGFSEAHHQLIKVFPVPEAGFEIEEGLEGADGVESLELMNYSTGAFSYTWNLVSNEDLKGDRWSSNEFQPSLETRELPREARSVRLVAVNSHGCSDTAVAEIPEVSGSQELTLRFPTAFSPNITGPTGSSYSPHEKRTDLFHPHFRNVPGEYHLKVYTKMGELVFESRDIYVGWDGYYQQERTTGGVYLWVAEGTWENGSTFSLKGDVTLLWNGRWP